MRDDTKVPEPIQRDSVDSLFELGGGLAMDEDSGAGREAAREGEGAGLGIEAGVNWWEGLEEARKAGAEREARRG